MFKAHNFCSFCFPSLPLKWGGQGISPPPLFTGVLLFCVNMTVNDLAFVAKLYTKKSVFYAIYIYLRPCKGREGTSGGHSAPSNNHQSGQKFNLNCADDSQHTGEQPWQLNFASAQQRKLTKKKKKKKKEQQHRNYHCWFWSWRRPQLPTSTELKTETPVRVLFSRSSTTLRERQFILTKITGIKHTGNSWVYPLQPLFREKLPVDGKWPNRGNQTFTPWYCNIGASHFWNIPYFQTQQPTDRKFAWQAAIPLTPMQSFSSFSKPFGNQQNFQHSPAAKIGDVMWSDDSDA